MRGLWLIVMLAGSAGPARAQRPAIPTMTAGEAKDYLDKGMTIETRLDADLDRDGDIDTVLVGRGEDRRMLVVVRADSEETFFDRTALPPLALDPYPLGSTALSAANGVLRVEELSGGTTADNTVYRFRMMPGAEPRLRLIGIDVKRYSRTNAHDAFEVSWNLLTGDFITRKLPLDTSGGPAAYRPAIERRSKRASPPLYSDTTPDPATLVETASAAGK